MFAKSRAVFVVAMALAMAAVFTFDNTRVAPIVQSHAVTTAPQPVVQGRPLPDFSTLVETAGPAVVNISVVRNTAVGNSNRGIDPKDPMFEFFRRFQIPPPQNTPQQNGVGSGFIISADGHILTNAHVVVDASEVMVKLTDKREFRAHVVGMDRRTDVALIKIDGRNLPTVRIGDSSRTRVGEWVAAIGSPFGFENSVTAGIVSAKARVLPDEGYVPFLQTDVAVNPGNSGGPLLNVQGEVIGINSQIYSRTGGYMGVSFAIPIEVAIKIKDELQQFGKVSRGKLGVTVQPVSADLAASFSLPRVQGALVNAVETGSPASGAGLVPGDIILGVNDQAVEQPADLVRAIAEYRPAQDVKLRIWRKGETLELHAKLVAFPAEKTAAAASAK
jgi:serine protease Do